jgi:hypothetical protein
MLRVPPAVVLLPLLFSLAGAAEPAVEVEEAVAACRPPGNGAGPLWCYGAPLLVRQGDRVFASVMETGEGVPPNCNTRWRMFVRDDRGWREARHAEGFREREPCPLVAPGRGKLLLSVNPSTEPPGTLYGRCDPHLLLFDTANPERRPTPVRPEWPRGARFTEHSYRGLAADPSRGDVLALNIDASTEGQHWSFLTPEGATVRSGTVRFPIRACYPQVAVRDRAAHVLAVGDIVEPNEAWRAYKKQKTGSAWDYVFRRLFYARNPDASRGDFEGTVEVDSAEATAGHITNLDLWLDAEGRAHLLYLKTSLSETLRDRFFPGRKVIKTLEYVEVEGGGVARRSTLMTGGEGRRETPRYARFHATPDGALHVVLAVAGSRPDGSGLFEDRFIQVLPRVEAGRTIPLKEPFGLFFSATERGGSAPSDTLDLFGTGRDGATLRYARVRMR